MKSIYLFIFFLLSLYCHAQDEPTSVCGRILYKNGSPAENVVVSIKNSSFATETGSDGRFMLKCPLGKQTISITSGDCCEEISCDAEKGKTLLFPNICIGDDEATPPMSRNLEEVVVTGQYQPKGIRNSLYRVKVLDREFIESKQALDVEAILNTGVGLYFSHDMALGTSNIQIAGMGGNNVKILLDGIPLIDRNGMKQSLSDIDVNTIERIEIVDGPMSVIYGSDALAGIINIITKKKIKSGLSFNAQIVEENVGSEYHFLRNEGSHGKNIGFNYGFGNGWYVDGGYSARDFGGWRAGNENRARKWFPKTIHAMQGRVGYFKDKWDLYFRQGYSKNSIFNLSDVTAGSYTASTKKYIVGRYNSRLKGEYRLSETVCLNYDGSFQNYLRVTETTLHDLKNNTEEKTTAAAEQDKMHFTSLFSRWTAVISFGEKLSIQPGVEYSRETGSGDRIEANSVIHYADLIFTGEYTPYSRFSLKPGLRYTVNSSYKAPGIIPSLNAKVRVSTWADLRLSYAYGFRTPKLDELYASFHDSNHHIDGNKDLKPEKSNTFILSLSMYPHINEQVSFSSTINSSLANYKNHIDLAAGSDNPDYYTYRNIDDDRIINLGVDNKIVWRSLSASLNAGITGRETPDFEELKQEYNNLKRYKFFAEISSDISYKIDSKTNISLFYKYTGERYQYALNSNDALELIKRAAFHYGDLVLSRTIVPNLRVSVAVKNLLNVKDIESSALMESSENYHGSGANITSVGYGRYYSLGLRYDF